MVQLKNIGYYLAAALWFLLLSVWRNPVPFVEPRFWAEEATIYFQALQQAGWSDVLTLTANSNYQFLTNVFVKLASYAPLSYAPFVTTYLSACVASVLAVFIAKIARERAVPFIVLYLALSVIALAPMSYEIFASATNTQWYAGAIVLAIAALKLDRPAWVLVACVSALICGLSGPPSVILMPVFLVVGLVHKSKAHLMVGVVLLLCLLIQAYVVTSSEAVGRHFTLSPRLLTIPVLLHSVFGFWLPPMVSKAIGSVSLERVNFLAIMLVSALVLSFAAMLPQAKNRLLVLIILLAGFGAAIIQTYGAIGDPFHFLGGEANGGRYYFVSTCALALALMIGSSGHRKQAVGLLAVAALVQGLNTFSPRWQMFTTGPSWRDQVTACSADPCHVIVWPGLAVSLPFEQ